MPPVNTVAKRMIKAISRIVGRKSVAAAQSFTFLAAFVLLVQPVVAQTAFEEAGDVACSGALGQAVFLGFGLLTLVLVLVGLGQIAIGFLGAGGGGRGRRGERSTVVNGFVTLLGGLFLGSMGAVLDYLGINLDSCLEGGEILATMPFVF